MTTWDQETDVIVVGFGGTGACAAIEGVDNGAQVLAVERFSGGGTTRMSGGVTYLGGGTKYQKEAGFDDTPENMYNYVKQEAKDVVSEKTLKEFCEQSSKTCEWLEEQGVPFNAAFCPFKTSYPPEQYFLYFSGNESFPPFNETSTPAPRGHRAHGKGMPGGAFFKPIGETAVKKGAKVMFHTKAIQLITDNNGNVTGLEVSSIPQNSIRGTIHKILDKTAYLLRYNILFFPPLLIVFKMLFTLMEMTGRKMKIRAKKGVILAAGGFVHNRKMIQRYAPKYYFGAPLGSMGDDGTGIRMGQEVGGAVGQMSRVSAWRFINPPSALVKGIIIDRLGKRIINEQYYGAQLGEKMVEKHRGEAILIIDAEIWKEAHKDLNLKRSQWFQMLLALINLYMNKKKANTIHKLAKKCDIPASSLQTAVDAYNKIAESDEPDPTGKSKDFIKSLKPPFYAIDCSLDNKLFLCPTLTLGGLMVNEETGEVKREDGSVITGLYAAGRTAVGVTSKGYMSGLSIADGIFSGRRAARHAALKE